MKNNDLLTQYIKACNLELTDEEKKLREQEVMQCRHDFVMLKPARYMGACSLPNCEIEEPVVECVHCGLTNKFTYFMEVMRLIGNVKYNEYDNNNYLYLNNHKVEALPFESLLFNKLMASSYVKLYGLSTEVHPHQYEQYAINSAHISVLYQVAKDLNLGSDREVLETMGLLHELETLQEMMQIETKDDTVALVNRYKSKILTNK